MTALITGLDMTGDIFNLKMIDNLQIMMIN